MHTSRPQPSPARIREALLKAANEAIHPDLAPEGEEMVRHTMQEVVELLQEFNNVLSPSYVRKFAFNSLMDQVNKANQETGFAQVSPLSGTFVDVLTGLPQARQVAMTLILHGYSEEEAADLVAGSPRQAKNLVDTALSDLRQALSGQGVSLPDDKPGAIATLRNAWRERCEVSDPKCSSDKVWAAAHGELDPPETRDWVLRSAKCDTCALNWRVAWAVLPNVSRNPLLADSMSGLSFSEEGGLMSHSFSQTETATPAPIQRSIPPPSPAPQAPASSGVPIGLVAGGVLVLLLLLASGGAAAFFLM